MKTLLRTHPLSHAVRTLESLVDSMAACSDEEGNLDFDALKLKLGSIGPGLKAAYALNSLKIGLEREGLEVAPGVGGP